MLSKQTQKYLYTVFGYSKVENIDKETIKCLKENIELCSTLNACANDIEILSEYIKVKKIK